MNNTVTIHSRRLAIYLQCRGFLLIGVEQNLNDSYKKVFIFNSSERIQKAMREYKQDKTFTSYLSIAEGM